MRTFFEPPFVITCDDQFRVAVRDGHVWSMAPAETERAAGETAVRAFSETDARVGREALRQLHQRLADPFAPFDVSLHSEGTPLQEAVWRALVSIPVGETRTYSQLAQMVDRPAACRAVAQACGRNQLAIVVPCHRIVRRDGGLGGYRWGLARKRALLRHEAECALRARPV